MVPPRHKRRTFIPPAVTRQAIAIEKAVAERLWTDMVPTRKIGPCQDCGDNTIVYGELQLCSRDTAYWAPRLQVPEVNAVSWVLIHLLGGYVFRPHQPEQTDDDTDGES